MTTVLLILFCIPAPLVGDMIGETVYSEGISGIPGTTLVPTKPALPGTVPSEDPLIPPDFLTQELVLMAESKTEEIQNKGQEEPDPSSPAEEETDSSEPAVEQEGSKAGEDETSWPPAHWPRPEVEKGTNGTTEITQKRPDGTVHSITVIYDGWHD